MGAEQIWVVIPAYNEAKVLGEVLGELIEHAPSYHIVVVDDGSSDDSAAIAIERGVHVLRHPLNLGQGASLATGITYALKQGAHIIITYDADGQMSPEDIDRLAEELVTKNVDVVLGSRFLSLTPEEIPRTKKFVLKLATLFTRMTTRLKVTDTHNGIRAFTADAARKINITQNRMAHASEILSKISRNGLSYREIPVTIRYTPYSRAKGQFVFNSLNILFELFTGDTK